MIKLVRNHITPTTFLGVSQDDLTQPSSKSQVNLTGLKGKSIQMSALQKP